MGKDRFVSVDFMKGIAMLMVILVHFSQKFSKSRFVVSKELLRNCD